MSAPLDASGLDAVLRAIDAANAQDPNLIETADGGRPKEMVHAERMTAWVFRLDPDADIAQQIAARAHHFRRWTSPRADYPDGRAGYLRWRRDARRRHADEVGELLMSHRVDEDTIADVTAIIRKERLGTDPRAQVHEDALCLTFFELQALDTAGQLGDRTAAVVEKTLAKMSPAGRAMLVEAELAEPVRALVTGN